MNIYIDDELYKCRDNERDKINVFEMPDGARQYYFMVYSYYSQMFIEYLKKNTSISKIDQILLNSELNFKTVEDDNKDFYQTLSNGLNYYYLRNNLYLYRLTENEREFLKERLVNNNYKFDEEVEKFIEGTFKKIIFENVEDGLVININFGPRESNHFAQSNSIVIGVRYDELHNDGLSDDEWYKKYMEKNKLIYSVSEELSNNLKDKLGCNSCVFQYNDYSVKKKSSLGTTIVK